MRGFMLTAVAALAVTGGGARAADVPAKPAVGAKPEAAAKPKRPEPPRPVSPEISADGKVTFRLYAPDARKVEVSGDFTAKAIELGRGPDGVWSASVSSLAAGMWGYSFKADGVALADPVNAWVKPSRYPTTSMLHIPGTPPQIWDDQGQPAGTVHVHRYLSKVMGMRRPLRVYTPPGYEKGNARYPVLYLLHGYSDNQDAWTTFGHAHVIADNLIAAKKAVPAIIVMTDGHTVPLDRERMRENVANMQKDLVESVVPFVDGLYRSKKSAADRGIVGLSMGGEHALTTGLANPGLFAWVGGMSSGTRNMDLFDAALADPTGLNKKLRLLWIWIGKDDFLLEDNRKFTARLTEKGVTHEYKETEGAHTWPVWRGYLAEFLPRVFVKR